MAFPHSGMASQLALHHQANTFPFSFSAEQNQRNEWHVMFCTKCTTLGDAKRNLRFLLTKKNERIRIVQLQKFLQILCTFLFTAHYRMNVIFWLCVQLLESSRCLYRRTASHNHFIAKLCALCTTFCESWATSLPLHGDRNVYVTPCCYATKEKQSSAIKRD